MISGHWFTEEDFLRIGQKLHKITYNSMKNRGRIPILTHLVDVPQGTSTKNLKQISDAVREKKSKMGYSIVTLIIHCRYPCYVTTQKLISLIQRKLVIQT